MEKDITIEKLYDVVEGRINETSPTVNIGGVEIPAGTALRSLNKELWEVRFAEELVLLDDLGLVKEKTHEKFVIDFNEESLLEMFKGYNK